MQSKRRPEQGVEHTEQAEQEVADHLAGLLPEGALDDAVQGLRPEELTGPGGLLSRLAGRVLEAALQAELTEHVGHPPGATPAGANVRNGVPSSSRAFSSAISAPRSPPKISAGPHSAFSKVWEKTAFGFSFIAVAIGPSDAAQCGPMIS